MSNLDDIKARLQAATPGPWEANQCTPCWERNRLDVMVWANGGNALITGWCDDDEFHQPDADLIAHAPTDLARLVAAVEAVERRCKDLEQLADGDKHYAKIFRDALAEALGEAA